jgi:hypothetical protein
MTSEESRKTAISHLLVVLIVGTAGLALIPIGVWVVGSQQANTQTQLPGTPIDQSGDGSE